MNSPNELGVRAVDQEPMVDDDDEIDLLEYWHIINRHKWAILGFAGIVCVLTYVVVSAMTPIFESTATLMIESKQANVVSVQEVYGVDTSQREYYQTQFEVLNSRKLAEKVVRELNIANEPEYDPDKQDKMTLRSFIPFLPKEDPPTAEQLHQAVIKRFRDNLSIEPIRNTQLVKIRFDSADPTLAPKVANALGEAYIDNFLQSQLDATQKAASWLTDKLKGMRGDLEASEKRLQDFQEKENLVNVKGVETLTAQELNELTSRLVAARNKTSIAKSQLDAVGDVNQGYQSAWETLPGVLGDELAQKLKQDEADAENNFSEIVKRYGPKHPKYIAAKTRLETAKQAYQHRVHQIISGFKEDYDQALADQKQIESQLAKSKQEIQEINRKQFKLAELQREVETNRELYNMFFQRFKETSEATDFKAANARFVDHAERSYVPVKPRKLLITGLAGVLAVMFGVLLAFLRAALDNTIRVAGEIEEKLGQSVLGVLPLEAGLLKQGVNISRLYLEKGQHTFSEAVRSLRTSVVLSGMDSPHKITVVTSSVPAEGKTTVASNLALALGQMERVLLIDADMRRPSLAKEFGLERSVGLAELVAHTQEIDECIYSPEGLGIDVLPAGTVPPNPLDLLSSGRFGQVLESLKERYDRIVIDSAPTQAVSDALVLSTKANALIYVVKSDSTAANVAQNGIQRLLRVGAPIIGVVLNQFDASAAQKYGYGGSDQYGYYGYGYSSKAYE